MDTGGLAALITVLNDRCDCEIAVDKHFVYWLPKGKVPTECKVMGPPCRWWNWGMTIDEL